MEKSSLPWSVNRLRATFLDSVGNSQVVHGTGFWINVDDYLREFAFVTNRHNIIPGLKDSRTAKLSELTLELRKIVPVTNFPSQSAITPETRFIKVNLDTSAFYAHGPADCAVIYPVCFQGILDNNFKVFTSFRLSDLADKSFFDCDLCMTDICHFIGFPYDSSKTIGWWDQKYNTPIARFASIASHPASYTPFTHPEINVPDVVLVSGLSFAGSSGSPVVSETKGIGTDHPSIGLPSKFLQTTPKRTGPGRSKALSSPNVDFHFVDKNFVPSRIIGIMTGHCKRGVQENLEHSGLSYFTRSTSIIRLMESAGFQRNELGSWTYPQKFRQRNYHGDPLLSREPDPNGGRK